MKLISLLTEDSQYSKNGVLLASKKVTIHVAKYLKKHPISKENWLHGNFDNIIHDLATEFATKNTLANLNYKYGSINTYLTYLIKYLMNY